MQLVHEFVGVGAHGLHDVLHAGQLPGQAGHFGAVAEDRHRAHDLPVPPYRHPVRQHADPRALGLHADAVLGLAGMQHAGNTGLGADGFQQLAHGGVFVQREQFRRGPVQVDHPVVPVDGQQPFVQRVQQFHAAQEQVAEGVGFVPQQVAFDPPRQLQAQQRAHAQRRQPDEQIDGQRAQHRKTDGAQVQPGRHVAPDTAVVPAHGGVGAVVGAHGRLGVVQQRGRAVRQLPAQPVAQRLQRAGIAGPGHDVIKVQRDAVFVVQNEQVDACQPLHRAVHIAVRRFLAAVAHDVQRVGHRLHGRRQRVVAHAVFLHQAQGQARAGGQHHRHQDAQHRDPADAGIDRMPGRLFFHGKSLLRRGVFLRL